MPGKGHGEKLTRKMTEAIIALMTTTSIGQAAQQCGLAASTLERWIKEEPVFQRAYRQARHQALDQTLALLLRITGTAVATLHTVMRDETAQPSARVSAAKATLELAIRGVELVDLEQRIAALEHRGLGLLGTATNGWHQEVS